MATGIPPTLRKLAVPLDSLRAFHANARRGDVDYIKGRLEALGQFRPIVVNKGELTGRENEVLAGNHTLQAARELGWPKLAVTFVNVDDAEARRIVHADNAANDRASYDESAKIELFEAIAADEGGLAAAGVDQAELDELLERTGGSPLADGFDPAPPDRAGEAGVQIRVGEYHTTVDRTVFETWLGALQAEVAFDESVIVATLLERLGLPA